MFLYRDRSHDLIIVWENASTQISIIESFSNSFFVNITDRQGLTAVSQAFYFLGTGAVLHDL